MRLAVPSAAIALLLCACGDGANESPPPAADNGSEVSIEATSDEPAAGPSAVPAAGWDLQSSGEGVALVLAAQSGPAAIRLFCPAGQNRLLVNVPAFRPIGSEERLSFGSGGEATALVADSRGDKQRGGVSGTSEVPEDLAALVGGRLSASYGAQTSGPHPAPPRALAQRFVAACNEGRSAGSRPTAPSTVATGPCYIQDGKPLRLAPLRAIGTEPFWGARIEGRCVTYSHPDDQKGTRIWTRFDPAPGGGRWSGALAGRRFELRTRAAPGCSDGMSDNRYPIAVDLVVAGEQRRGCARPL